MDAATRQFVRRRAGERCVDCRIHQDDEPFYRFHVERIVAKVQGGADDSDNLALACHICNAKKGTNLAGRDALTDNISDRIELRAGLLVLKGM